MEQTGLRAFMVIQAGWQVSGAAAPRYLGQRQDIPHTATCLNFQFAKLPITNMFP